jgi:hypothetical protein
MPSNPDVFYLSAKDYQKQTSVPALVEPLTGDAVTQLLLETMALMDAYVGSGWAPFDPDQEFIFPRSDDRADDGTSFIPRPVALATRIIADAILEERSKGVLPHQVVSESSEGHSYTKHYSSLEVGFEVIPPNAQVFLDKYRRHGGQFAVQEPNWPLGASMGSC